MLERPNFGAKEQEPKIEIVKVQGIQIVDQMTIPAIKGIDEEKQKEINKYACGAALMEMMSRFWQQKGQLEKIVTAKQALWEVFGVDLEKDFREGDPDTHIYPGLGCTVEALAKAGKKIGLQGSNFFYHWPLGQILDNVENGFPTIMEVGARDVSKNHYVDWTTPSGKHYWQLTNGHFVLITGFERDKKTGVYSKIFVADTLHYTWFDHYNPQEFKSAAYNFYADNPYYWGQGVILKP